MDPIMTLKRQILRQQKQIDALATTQTFLFSFLARLANVDLGLSTTALSEILEDSYTKENKYLHAQLKRLKEVSEKAYGLPQENTKEVPTWFQGIIKGGLSDENEDEF